MKASMRTVPMASKKLPGLLEASDVLSEPPQVVLLDACDWNMSEDAGVFVLVLWPFSCGLPRGPEKPRNDSGGGMFCCPPVLLRLRACAGGGFVRSLNR